MKVTILEGTPEEIAEFLPSVRAIEPPKPQLVIHETAEGTGIVSDSQPHETGNVPASLEVARRVLTRRRLSDEQRTVLKTLYNEHPHKVSTARLLKVLNYKRQQFTGLMGAFGNRFSHTDGAVVGSYFFEQEWDGSSNSYGLPESVREALRLEKLV